MTVEPRVDVGTERLLVFIENYCKLQVDLEEARHRDTPKDKLIRIGVICLAVLLALVIIITLFAYIHTVDGYKEILNGLVVIEQDADINTDSALYNANTNIIKGVDDYESELTEG